MKFLIENSYNLSLGGLIVALTSSSISLLLKASYSAKPKKWKNEVYQLMWRFQHLGFAVSAIGGAMLILYIWLEIRGV